MNTKKQFPLEPRKVQRIEIMPETFILRVQDISLEKRREAKRQIHAIFKKAKRWSEPDEKVKNG